MAAWADSRGAQNFRDLALIVQVKQHLPALPNAWQRNLKDEIFLLIALALGAVQTEMFAQAFPGERAQMTPLQMAHFIKDFALTGAAYFNGKILPVY